MKKLYFGSFVYLLACAVVFLAMHAYGLSGDYVASIVTAGVGYVAYFVYVQGKINVVQDTAKMLILDIRNAEEALDGVRAGANSITWSKLVLAENNWSKYKQYFVGYLNTDEFRKFEQFFHNWSQLVQIKHAAEGYSVQVFVAKAAFAQQRILELDDNAAEFRQHRQKIIDRTNSENWIFDPDSFSIRINHFLATIQPLSGTTGFAKIRMLAKINE